MLTTTTVAVAATSVAVVGLSATPASAATACAIPDLYAHHTVTPANATGGANVAAAKFGAVVATGDFNKDGFADVAVGAPGDQVSGVAAGTVTIFNGSAAGISATGKRLTQTNIGAGNEAGDKFGAALAVGDFNKDGYADLAVGTPGEADGTAAGAGAIAVFKGAAAGLNTGTFYSQATLSAGADEAGDAFGTALAAGDLNGDGYADLAIGTPGEAPAGTPTVHTGGVYVYKGASTGVVYGWVENDADSAGTNEAGDKFGAALAIGNVTGDSHADLVVGVPGEAPASDPAGGAIAVIPGAASGKSTGFGRSQDSDGGANEAGDAFGSSVAVGNFDKDGYADIAVGIPNEAPSTAPAGGSVAIFPGAATQVAAGYTVSEENSGETIGAGDKFGLSLATGDTNKDGYADLLIGAPGKVIGTTTSAGTSYLFNGGPRQTGTTRSLLTGRRIGQSDVGETNETNDAFGAGVALGDLTGDGAAEAVIGSSGEAQPGLPASGATTALTNLAPRAATAIPLASFTPTVAMQAAPGTGASVGTLEYAYSDNIGRLLHGHQSDPESFLSVQWTVISNTLAFTGQPSMAQQQDGKLQLAAHNANSTVNVDTETNTNPATWGAWASPAGAMATAPTMVKQADGTVVSFAVDAGGVLWALPETVANSGYTSWISLGIGGLAGAPTVVPVSNGIQVFALNTSGAVTTALYANRMVSGCTTLAGSGFTGRPSVVLYPGSKLRVFATAADGSIQTMKQGDTGAFPDAWDTVGTFTSVGSPAALLSPSTGKTEVVARGADGAIYSTGETIQGSGIWRDWKTVTVSGDSAATDPTVFSYSGTSLTWAFVFRNSNNESRVYEAVTSGVDSPQIAGRARTATAATGFTAHTLPAPPAQ